MFELIIESNRIDAKKNNVIQISADFTKYILLVENLIEFDITKQVSPMMDITFRSDTVPIANIIFKSGESLYNIPVKYRGNR